MTASYCSMVPHGYYLSHSGVQGKSGRYPLGSGDRPYQRLERARRPGFFARRKEAKRQKELLEKKKKLLEENRKKQEEAARLKADKERVLREGTATEVRQYLGELSNQELAQAVERIQWMKRLDTFTEAEAKKAAGKSTFEQVDQFMTNLGKVNKWGETAINSYKNAKVIVDFMQRASAESKMAKESGIKNPYIRQYEKQKKEKASK